MSTPAGPERDLAAEFAAFRQEMAEMVLETSGVPEAERDLWRELR